jgi:threonylcarbamoyladenosine tRNA methylthiotransferase MtaB
VFPFSPRKGTPAARMPQLDRRTVKERARRLREKGAAALKGHLAAQVGRSAPLLMENAHMGRTPQFAPVRLTSPQSEGAVIAARLTGHDGTGLEGTALQ